MSEKNLRRRAAYEAARLIYTQEQTGYFQAKRKAVRRFYGPAIRIEDLPSNREILGQIQAVVKAENAKQLKNQSPASEACQSVSQAFIDRFRVYELLLLPLEKIREEPQKHPEGDVLYHSLQVFELARNALPYDEEFLLAALLHDVGKAIDPRDHIAAGLEALEGYITVRTAWLIEHHGDGLSLRDQKLGARTRRRLQADNNFDELMLLAECDRRGRAAGMAVPDVKDAIEYLRNLEKSCGSF
ncbi:MAG: HD domain-containing protein [Thermoguttaceae bacterium]